jgi:hypothetical protein
MPRPQPRARERRYSVSPTGLFYASDGLWCADESIDVHEQFVYNYPDVSECSVACETVWRLVETDLLEDWIENGRAGTRPRYWWHYSAPEPCRQRLGGLGQTEWQKYRSVLPCFTYGLPQLWYYIDSQDPPYYESQSAFLRRHGLFLPNEECLLTERDFAPQFIRNEKH